MRRFFCPEEVTDFIPLWWEPPSGKGPRNKGNFGRVCGVLRLGQTACRRGSRPLGILELLTMNLLRRLAEAPEGNRFPQIPFILRSPPLARGSPGSGEEKGLLKAPFGLQNPPLQLPDPLFELLPTPFQLPFLYKNFIIIRRIHNNIKGFRDIGIDRGPCTATEKCVTRACACARMCRCIGKNRRLSHRC